MSLKNVFLLSVCFVAYSHAMTPAGTGSAAASTEIPADGHVTDIEQIRPFFSADGSQLNPLFQHILSIDSHVFDQIADEFPRLRGLNLSGNKLTELPDSIGNLSQLQFLWIMSNQLTHLPESIGNLSQLRQLWLQENQLTHLPESIGNFSQLQEFELEENNLMYLPDSIDKCTELKSFDLDGNPFLARTDWPARKLALEQKNRKVFISDKLPTPPHPFPATITDAKQIISSGTRHFAIKPRYDSATHTLDLSYLPITHIEPHVFAQIADLWPDLEIIDLSYTQLAATPELRETFVANLEILRENGVYVDKVIFNVRGTEHILDIHNHIHNLESIKSYYKSSVGTFGDITGGIFSLPSIGIKSFDPDVFKQMADDPETKGTQALFLMGNPLKTLPETVTQLTELRTINLEDTRIESLPIAILLMPNLRKISLTNTPFASSPLQPESLAMIQQIHALRKERNLPPLVINGIPSAEEAALAETATMASCAGEPAADVSEEILHAQQHLHLIRGAVGAGDAARAITEEEKAEIAHLEAFIESLQSHVGKSKRGE